MKIAANLLILVTLFVLLPIVALRTLAGNKRHVIVRQHREHGAVVINNKKVRVPYTLQETAIPAEADGMIEYFFLNDYQICLASGLTLFAMGLLLIGIYLVNTIEGKLLKYRPVLLKGLFISLILFAFAEWISSIVYSDWVIDTKHGINGNGLLFGINATFPNATWATLDLSYHADVSRFIVPLIALAVLMRNARKREVPADDTFDNATAVVNS